MPPTDPLPLYEVLDEECGDLFDDYGDPTDMDESQLIYKPQAGKVETPVKIINSEEIKARLLAVETATQKKREAVVELDQALKAVRSILSAYKGYAIQLDDETIIQVNPNKNGFSNGQLYTKLKVVKL